MMATVFAVTARSDRDLSDAERYGKIRYILPDGFQIVNSPIIAENKLKRALHDFSDEDYLLLMGDPVLIGVAALVAGISNMGKVRILKWDRKKAIYLPIQINIFRKDEEEEDGDDPFVDVVIRRR